MAGHAVLEPASKTCMPARILHGGGGVCTSPDMGGLILPDQTQEGQWGGSQNISADLRVPLQGRLAPTHRPMELQSCHSLAQAPACWPTAAQHSLLSHAPLATHLT